MSNRHSKLAKGKGLHVQLPIPFVPTTRKVTQEDREQVTKYTPFSELPPVLYPKLSNSYKAPIMHCGWTMERLWKYTENNGFAVRPIIDYRDFLTEEEEDEYGDEDEDEDLIDDDSPEVGLLDPEKCMKNALAHLVDKLDIKEILATTATEMIVANPHNGFLSLYTNYSVRRAPSLEAIEKLRVALGEEEGPKWYLDAFHWYWKPRPASAIRAKPKPQNGRSKKKHLSNTSN